MSLKREQAEQIMHDVEGFKRLPVVAQGLVLLQDKLDPSLTYHSVAHTHDVLHEAILFASLEHVSERDKELLAIAAAWHDTGFIERRVENEPIGARFAAEAMRACGYDEGSIEIVSQMILDTRMLSNVDGPKQVANTSLSPYLLDADLSNFGRDDFREKMELHFKEIPGDRAQSLARTYVLLTTHQWYTNAARSLRQMKKEENIAFLGKLMDPNKEKREPSLAVEVSLQRLEFLARLPLLINCSLNIRKILDTSLEHVKKEVRGEAATIFIKEPRSEELVFWALKGDEGDRLEGLKMPSTRGIVGWVLKNQDSVRVKDVESDPRFFSEIDSEGGFDTRSVLCVPLTVRGSVRLGAIQVLNHEEGEFSYEDLVFVEQFAHQVALAVDNSQLYNEVLKRNKQLEQLDKKKSEMLRVLAHELKTPVTIVQSSAEILSMGYATDEASIKKISETLNVGIERILKVASQLRNVAMISRESVATEIKEMDISSLVTQLGHYYEKIVKTRNLTLHIDVGKGCDAAIGDENLIFVALKNLVSNAVRFTDDGGNIVIKASRSAGMVEFSVIDNGIGIDHSQQTIIFEKFYEIADSMNHSSGEHEFRSGGLGLGLAAVQSILDVHRASISVESELGKGSKFSFHLPVSRE